MAADNTIWSVDAFLPGAALVNALDLELFHRSEVNGFLVLFLIRVRFCLISDHGYYKCTLKRPCACGDIV